jgi:tRNA threonylcarbamoyladenosine biosynthesis protein TsaB
VALVRGEEILVERSPDAPGQHAERILPLIDAVLSQAGLGPSDPEAYAVSIGPGSFTSLRVGLATVKGLAFGSERPIVPVPTLEALAWGALAPGDDTPIAALLDARRGEVYAAVFEPEGPALRQCLPDGLFSPEALAPLLPAGCRLAGEAALLFGDALQALVGGGLVLPSAHDPQAPRASWVGRLAARRLGRDDAAAEALAPRYVRRAEAEVTRTSRVVEDST